MSTIKALYRGEIAPHEQGFHHHSAYRQITHTIIDSEQKLMAFLADAPQAQKWLETLKDAEIAARGYGEQARFVEGFRMGASLMLDVLAPGDT